MAASLSRPVQSQRIAIGIDPVAQVRRASSCSAGRLCFARSTLIPLIITAI